MVVLVFSWTLLVRGEERSPEIAVTKSSTFDTLENILSLVIWHYLGTN